MARRKVTSPTETEIPPQTGQSDPLMREMDKYVLNTLKGNGSERIKAQAAAIGLKLLQVKHKIIGDTDEGDFFD